MKFVIFICLLLISFDTSQAQTGVITTIVGTGYPHDTGNGGPATAAGICLCHFSAPDNFNEYYLAQGTCNSVRKVSSGLISEFAGTGTAGYSGDGSAATSAMFNDPRSVAIDSAGNIYVGENVGARIRKIDRASSNISTFAGNGYLLDTGDGGAASLASMYGANDICFDRKGNLYFISAANRVRRIDATTKIINTVAGTGVGGYSGDGGQATLATISGVDIYVDSAGNIFIADGSTAIRKVDAITHIISHFAGNDTGLYNGEGLSAFTAGINPFSITGDNNGNIYIGDRRNHRIRMITNSGYVYTVAGTGSPGFSGDGGPATAAKLHFPEGVELDACGNIMFLDNQNYRIRKVTFPGNDKPSITITASSGNRLCYGMPVTFRASTARGGRAPVYQWKVNGTSVGASAPTYTYTPANGDSVQCVLTSNSYCVINPMDTSNTLYMSVGTLAPPVVAISGISSANTGSSVTVTAAITGSIGAYTLEWANHGTTFATTTVPTVTYTKPAGNDTITATLVSMGKGCYDSVVSNAHVVRDPHLGVPGANAATKEVLCYPNPVGNTLFVSASETQYQIRVYDLLGQVIYTGASTGNKTEVPMAHVIGGIYIIKCIFNDGTTEVTRFIKQ